MASDKVHPLIPFDAGRPAFCVTTLRPHAGNIAAQFTKPHLYQLGSDQGCGCGFAREHDWLNEDPGQIAATRGNQENLARYLSNCLADEESVELYGCWNGDEELPPVQRRTLSLQDLLGKEFGFIEKEHITVKR